MRGKHASAAGTQITPNVEQVFQRCFQSMFRLSRAQSLGCLLILAGVLCLILLRYLRLLWWSR